jgi:hypothetical protein
MRTEFGYAWSQLYLAMLAMATSTAPLPERVLQAFQTHLGSLGRDNLPPLGYERLKTLRARLGGLVDSADEGLPVAVATADVSGCRCHRRGNIQPL